MPKLRHLYITVACCLRSPSVKMDISLWPFTSKCIQVVSGIRFASCTREVFISMPSLRMLGLSETKEDYEMDWSAKCLKELFYLQELWTFEAMLLQGKYKNTENLDALPSNLRKLTISWSYQPWQNMTSIASLPELEVLKLKNYAFQGPKWEPTEGGFRVLKHLLVEKTDLVSWEATSNHFPCLEHLVLKSCKYLKEVPYGITEISTLKRIELHNCSESAKISATSIEVESLDVVIKSDRFQHSA
ncbi:putative late blight resistance protein homolog R1B-16 [Coffea eugenioides]|nr:putative late blight resistance protein homolog R1B-16 [Coffea eugenioides]